MFESRGADLLRLSASLEMRRPRRVPRLVFRGRDGSPSRPGSALAFYFLLRIRLECFTHQLASCRLRVIPL
jgi:hypothetical protein